MGKEKSRDTTIWSGGNKFSGKHNVPRIFVNLFEELLGLDCVKTFGLGRYRIIKRPYETKIVGYDNLRNSYIINISKEKFEQKLFIGVEDENSEHLKEINDCIEKNL